MSRGIRALLLLAVLVGECSTSPGRADGSAADALVAVSSGDPMDYAAVTRRIGDAALRNALGDDEASAELRLAALRASPYARAPELLLEPVVQLARGSDPALAPGALRAASQIASGLEFHLLEQRENDPALLEAPAEALTELADDDEARADLRQLARDVAARLRALQREPEE